MGHIMDRYLDGMNSGTLTQEDVEAIFAPNYVEHQNDLEVGRDAVLPMATGVRAAFPDFKIDFNLRFSTPIDGGELVTTHWTFRGTHQGELQGIPPTGKKVEFHGMSVWKIVDGRNVEEWEIADRLTMMQQLGVVPTPEST